MLNQDTILAFLKVSKDAQIQRLGELKQGITVLILDSPYFKQIGIEDVIITPDIAFITQGTCKIGYYESNIGTGQLKLPVAYNLLKFPMIEISRALIQQGRVYKISEDVR